ncbi:MULTISPECIES: hypothetical protein [Enterobacter cloacae complex]|uniref:hypothetical protein n=1 Tax=Enterobacter cloacae complex TaxID=354276 RepID=UPI002109F745|nr:hypothetical protein [Enterobacter asburiae]MCQ4454978.1 hypothetical protein [Enterobacter asburiae]
MSKITRERAAQIAAGGGYNFDEVEELARIALASLEAEPDYYVVVTSVGVWQSFCKTRAEAEFIVSKPFNPGYSIREIYTTPPAPVSVADESAVELLVTDLMERIDKITGERHSVATLSSLRTSIVKACRAAMLQSADGALTNEDTKRVGELVMWVKRLAHSLRKSNPDSKLQSDAMDYLSRKGLIGVEDILR